MDFTETQEGVEQQEGKVAEAIETETAKLPSDLFLWTALGAMAVSFALQMAGKKHISLFFGQWVAPFLLFGIYNKMVKQHGHDQMDNGVGNNNEL